MPGAVGALRPDYLLAPGIIDYFGIEMVETNEGTVAFAAALKTAAGYAKANVQVTPDISIDAGVRYEKAKQRVDPIQVFKVPGASTAGTRIEEGYWLPAATLTWQLRNDLQFRLNASKTIARPQFRELIYQFYFDPESNRMYQGNPLLEDGTVGPHRQPAAWPRSAVAPVAADAADQLCQRACSQPRDRQYRPARHHRKAGPAARFRGA